MKHAFVGSEGGGGTAPVERVQRFTPSSPQYEARRSRGQVALAITVAAHAAIGVALWNAKARQAPAPPPQRVEVSLIAPPERPKPPPPPPPRPVHRRVQVQQPTPAPVPQLDATPLALPTLAAPQPVAIPVAEVITPIESPITVAPVSEPSPAPSSIAAPPAPPAEPAVTPPRFDAAYLDNPPPAYPPAARRAREQGRVLLRVLVSADGRALSVDVARSSGSVLLDEAAKDAVRRWRFVPARRGDVAVQAHVQVPIVFSLTR